MVSATSQNQAAASSALAAAQWTNKDSGSGLVGDKWSEEELVKMAEYSADLYAKNKEERDYYVEYYKKFYRNGGDTSAAKVALKEDVGKKNSDKKSSKDKGTVIVDGVEYKKYSTPDTSSYQYDDTSGYYYDPVSTLYYDANSQYYYNSKNNKFFYWDARHETFLPAPDHGNGGDRKEDERKSSSKEKVKSAKKIQKDMEKWAKTLNQRKDNSRSAVDVRTESSSNSFQKGSEDIAFNLLQRKDEPQTSGLAGLAGYASDEEVVEEDKPSKTSSNMAIAEMKLTDWNTLACLLCQRQFKSRDQLQKHNTMSELHTSNMKNWRSQYSDNGDSGPQGGGMQYRDRAKERRNKFGDDDKPIPNKFKEKYLRALDDTSSASGSDLANAPKIAENNKGNKMLQKMGWKDGQGLGKKNQGRTDIILAQQRSQGTGLGTEQSSGNPNDSYKENARKTLWSRYNSAT